MGTDKLLSDDGRWYKAADLQLQPRGSMEMKLKGFLFMVLLLFYFCFAFGTRSY